jgi:HSP20 family protein
MLFMAGLVPFNKRKSSLSRSGFGDFYSMLDDFFSNTWPWPTRSFFPDTFRLDVKESEKEYNVEAEIPGVGKDEINIELDDGRLTISVDRNESIDEENENYIHRERRKSSMRRSVYLEDAKEEGIVAKLDNGILKITVPKSGKQKKSRRIEIV